MPSSTNFVVRFLYLSRRRGELIKFERRFTMFCGGREDLKS
jgi:hypothetical protein